MVPALALVATELVAVPAVLACNVAAVLIAGPTPARKAVAVALSGAAFAVAAAVPPPVAPLRGWLWFAASMLAMRVVDVLARPEEPVAARLTQLLLVYDPRAMRIARPRVALELVARALCYGVLAAVALGFAASAGGAWARWLGGGMFFYALLEALDGGFRALYAAMGLRAPPLQDQPLRSGSLAELWGRRWNREVGRWIHRSCFAPLARRGHAAAGVLAGFGFSALFHGAAAWAAVDARMGAWMASFFLVHGAAVLAERRFAAGWPGWARRAGAIGVCVLTLPLFAEPIVRLMGGPPG